MLASAPVQQLLDVPEAARSGGTLKLSKAGLLRVCQLAQTGLVSLQATPDADVSPQI